MRIVFLYMILCLFMTGCRMNKESKVSRSRVYADEIGMVLRRVDSLSGTISEKRNLTIDFYPPTVTDDLSTGNPIPAAPSAIFSAAAQGGGFGAVKRIEILDEKNECMSAISGMDSDVEITESENSETVDEISGKENNFESMLKSIKMLLIGAILAMWVLLCKIKEKKNRK